MNYGGHMDTTTKPAPQANTAHQWGDHRGGEVTAVEAEGSRLLIVLRLPTGDFYTRSIACSSNGHALACRAFIRWIEGLE